MDINEILSKVDHTLLAPTSTKEQIFKLCDEGIKYKVASVCIPPCYVRNAKKYVGDKLKICTVIGFPNGYNNTEVKLFETKNALGSGADEIDMVINICDLKNKNFSNIEKEIYDLKKLCGSKILKVIIETCLLTEEEKIKMCKIITKSGADFIKTSTGFSASGAKLEDIKLFAENIGENVKIKAAGGIKSLKDAEDFINCGASRLGTSKIVNIVSKMTD